MTDNYSQINMRKEASVSIIEDISRENREFQNQLKNVSQEMSKTASLGEYLMQENK